MRSNRLNNRLNKMALEQTDKKDWPKDETLEELDVPGNKAVAVSKGAGAACQCGTSGCPGCDKDKKASGCTCGKPGCPDCGTNKNADWIGDLIKQTVQYLTQHRNDPDLNQKIQALPIARKVGPATLQNPVSQFVQDGNSSALIGELETIVQGKRTTASKKKAEESSVEIDAPKKTETPGEQPEGFIDPKRPVPAEKPVKPSADNTPKAANPELSGTHRRVKLDEKTEAEPAPSAWSVDNTRELQHKAAGNFDTKKPTEAKTNPAPSTYAVDNTREMRHETKELTTEEQDQMKRKNSSDLEVFTPKTAEEVDMIVEASGSWVGHRLATGTFQRGMPSFILNASEAVAVISAQGDVFDAQSTSPTNKYASILNPTEATKKAAAGGSSEEPESEEETSVDTVVVSLLEACKTEWTNLGDPVNPATWPKEIDRALLSLNDELVAAIKKVEDKLVEGEFYSKNVDEGLEGGGSSVGVGSLNIAPGEEEVPESPESMDMGEEGLPEEDGLNTAADEEDEALLPEAPKTGGLKSAAAKTAVEFPDVTSAETRKALKFTQSLKDDIADKFFEFKKIVQEANDSSLIKNVGETFVGLKTKLEDVEKILSKQLQVLETAESAIQDKKDLNGKKSFLMADGGTPCEKCGEMVMHSPYGKAEGSVICEKCKNEKKEPKTSSDERDSESDHEGTIEKQANQYIVNRPGKDSEGNEAPWCILQKGTGKILSRHKTEKLAEESFSGMESSKHGSTTKTAACPVCGATVMQNGKDTNGVLCPNCANKPSTQAPGAPQNTTPAAPKLPQNGPVSPSPIKQYGSKSKFNGLNLAAAGE